MNPDKKKKKLPIVELLVENGFCASKTEASALVYAGLVLVNDQKVEKPGQLFPANVYLRVKRKSFVSRGGNKLSRAIEELGLTLEFRDKTVLDVGASTGGFTDCMLKHGAKRVVALDVGFNQLDWSLKTNPKVVSLEQMDIREFDPGSYLPFDWIIADVSFVSLERLAPTLLKLASAQTQFLILVKPQFELPGNEVPSGGVVRSEESWEKAIQNVLAAFEGLGAGDFRIIKSAVKGRSGNQEFFLYCRPKT